VTSSAAAAAISSKMIIAADVLMNDVPSSRYVDGSAYFTGMTRLGPLVQKLQSVAQ
jgi:hypothetical protein